MAKNPTKHKLKAKRRLAAKQKHRKNVSLKKKASK
jgi:hypothetical protein